MDEYEKKEIDMDALYFNVKFCERLLDELTNSMRLASRKYKVLRRVLL